MFNNREDMFKYFEVYLLERNLKDHMRSEHYLDFLFELCDEYEVNMGDYINTQGIIDGFVSSGVKANVLHGIVKLYDDLELTKDKLYKRTKSDLIKYTMGG